LAVDGDPPPGDYAQKMDSRLRGNDKNGMDYDMDYEMETSQQVAMGHRIAGWF
jgi:hypothetical protein